MGWWSDYHDMMGDLSADIIQNMLGNVVIREVLATFDLANDAILDNLVCDIDSDIYIEETVVK